MFWGGASRDRAAANLRTALYLLKRDLEPIGYDVLIADRNVVSLADGAIAISEDHPSVGLFLEGLDLKLDDGEVFEEWLRDMRSARDTSTDTFEGTASVPSGPAPLERRTVTLGLLPTLHANLDRNELAAIESIMDSIAKFTAYTTTVPLYDLRGYDIQAIPLPIEDGTGPTHLFQAFVDRRGGEKRLVFRLHEAGSRRILWITEPMSAHSKDPEEAAAVVCETLLQHLAAETVGPDAPDLFPWTALTALFSLDMDVIRRTDAQIEKMISDGAPPVFRCLQLFAQVFKENEGVEVHSDIDLGHICELVASVPATSPMLPLWQSLAGYSIHMLLGANDLADLMLENAYQNAPNLALNLDHIAVLRMIRGDLSGADLAFRKCQKVGISSPWRYTYDVTGAMISMAKGDYRQSLRFANQAMLRKPRFIGALRYAMAGSALAGNEKDADRIYKRIQRLRPDYDLGSWTENMIRRSSPELGKTLADGFKRTGIL